MLSAPAASRPSTASSPSSSPFTDRLSTPGRLSTMKKDWRPIRSMRAPPSSASSGREITWAAPNVVRSSILTASLATPLSPCSATRKRPARPSILNVAVAFVPVLPNDAGSSASDARSMTGVTRPAKRRSWSAGSRGKSLDQRHHAIERVSVEVERHGAAGRLPPGVDAPFRRQCGAGEVGDREPLDLEPVGIDAHADIGLLYLDASKRGAADLQRQGALARPIEIGVAQHRPGKCVNAVDIDLGRGQRGVETRRTVGAVQE